MCNTNRPFSKTLHPHQNAALHDARWFVVVPGADCDEMGYEWCGDEVPSSRPVGATAIFLSVYFTFS